MAVVKGPLFSLEASGTVGGAVVYSKWKGRDYVRRHVVPANPRSVGQLSVRAMMQFLTQWWDSLSDADQLSWDTPAAVTNISPFNAYVAYNLTKWGLNDTPSKAYPAAEVGEPGTLKDHDATAGVRSITVQAESLDHQDMWGVLVYRSLTTGLTGTRNQLVHVIPANVAAVHSWLDSPLPPAIEQFYKFRSFSHDSRFSALSIEVSATPTA